jgi:lipid II:glycine glycyltransferase (peptidoglycan interpeptide bridge formation enzyme)
MIEVVDYTSEWKDRWDQFVLESNNGTIFHLQKFLGYHIDRTFEWSHILFLHRGEILAVLPGARMGTTLESPIGASYGSFVTRYISFDTALALVDAFSQYCREHQFERALLTPPPFIYQSHISQNIDYALAYRGFQYDKHYISHAISLTESNSLSAFQSTVRRYVRKYVREREITTEISNDLDAFYPILIKNKERHGMKPTHSLAELKRLQRLFPERIVLFLVHRNARPIAGSLVFVCNKRVALCFYNMLLYEFERLRPIHAVMYEVVRWAAEKGFGWLDLGVSQDTHAENQMTPAMNLIRFKEKFNARGILRSTWYGRFR